jgi:protein TonB
MNIITRFKWPVIIAAGLHGALFVSFPREPLPPPPAVVDKPDLPPLPPVPVDLTPPEDSDAGDVGGGDAVASLPEVPLPPEVKVPFELPPVTRAAPERPVPDLKNFRGGEGDDGIFGPGNMKAPAIPTAGSLDRAPRTMSQTTPRYPANFRTDGIEGEATVEFVVGTDGRVLTAEAVRWTHREFALAAVDAVLRWKFEPGTINGRKVRFRMAIPVQFNMAH